MVGGKTNATIVIVVPFCCFESPCLFCQRCDAAAAAAATAAALLFVVLVLRCPPSALLFPPEPLQFCVVARFPSAKERGKCRAGVAIGAGYSFLPVCTPSLPGFAQYYVSSPASSRVISQPFVVAGAKFFTSVSRVYVMCKGHTELFCERPFFFFF